MSRARPRATLVLASTMIAMAARVVSATTISESLGRFINREMGLVVTNLAFPNIAGEFIQREALGSLQLPVPATSTVEAELSLAGETGRPAMRYGRRPAECPPAGPLRFLFSREKAKEDVDSSPVCLTGDSKAPCVEGVSRSGEGEYDV